jgi:hypothetical protein
MSKTTGLASITAIFDLIPRMRSWVNQYYPGTKTATTEYNFGALDSMNGALAEADALGIFGAQGLGMADLWSPPTPAQPGAFAFQMYRNDDNQGNGFGATSVQAQSSDQSQLSVYGAKRYNGILTVMVINKSANNLTSSLAISNFPAGTGSVHVRTYDAANLSAIVRQPDGVIAGGTFTNTYPADSITLLAMPVQATATTK